MFQFPRCPPRIAPGCPAVRRAGCPIRIPPDLRLPAPPRGISPRGRVLPRPPTPRHPPCALHAEALIRLRRAPIAGWAPRRAGPARASRDVARLGLPPGCRTCLRPRCRVPPTIQAGVGPSPPVRVLRPQPSPRWRPASERHSRPGAAGVAASRRGVCVMCVYLFRAVRAGDPTRTPLHVTVAGAPRVSVSTIPHRGLAISRGRRTSRVPRGALSRCLEVVKPLQKSLNLSSLNLCRNLPRTLTPPQLVVTNGMGIRGVAGLPDYAVEPRGFEPRTSAVQGRRSPG
jgi:hypothetical protein